MNPPPRILPLHSFFFLFLRQTVLHPPRGRSFSIFNGIHKTNSTAEGYSPQFFPIPRAPGSRRQFNSRERSKLGAAGVGANFKKSGGRPSLAGPVTAIETTYLVVETRMAGLSFPSPPAVWTPDFPLRRLPLLLITCRQIQFAEQ